MVLGNHRTCRGKRSIGNGKVCMDGKGIHTTCNRIENSFYFGIYQSRSKYFSRSIKTYQKTLDYKNKDTDKKNLTWIVMLCRRFQIFWVGNTKKSLQKFVMANRTMINCKFIPGKVQFWYSVLNFSFDIR